MFRPRPFATAATAPTSDRWCLCNSRYHKDSMGLVCACGRLTSEASWLAVSVSFVTRSLLFFFELSAQIPRLDLIRSGLSSLSRGGKNTTVECVDWH